MKGISRKRSLAFAGILCATALVATACGGAGSSGDNCGEQTIVFATQGLGAEGKATQAAIKGFEKEHPNIHVQLLTLSPTSDNAYQQLEQRSWPSPAPRM